MRKKWIIIWIILFVLLGIPYYITGDATIFIVLGIFFLLHAICKLIVYTAEKLNLTNAQWWYKKGQAIRRTKQKKSFTELQKSDSQAKVVDIIGKPDTIENLAELDIAKGRDIKLGTIFLKSELEYQRFADYHTTNYY